MIQHASYLRFFPLVGLDLDRTTCDGRNEHDLVAILERVGFPAEKADIFVVDIDVDEPAELAIVILDLRPQRGKGLLDVSYQPRQIGGGGVELLAAIGVAGESGREHNFDGH